MVVYVCVPVCMCVCVSVCPCLCVHIRLHIIAQGGPIVPTISNVLVFGPSNGGSTIVAVTKSCFCMHVYVCVM